MGKSLSDEQQQQQQQQHNTTNNREEEEEEEEEEEDEEEEESSTSLPGNNDSFEIEKVPSRSATTTTTFATITTTSSSSKSRRKPTSSTKTSSDLNSSTTKTKQSSSGGKRFVWTPQEDALLRELVMSSTTASPMWSSLARLIPGRTSKQCRERWCYNLDPSILRTPWEKHEDEILMRRWHELGNRWATIAHDLPGRTENAVKTRFKSLSRATSRPWKEEEDAIILNFVKENESSSLSLADWELLARDLISRSAHACRARYLELLHGKDDSLSPSPDTSRDGFLSSSSSGVARLSPTTKKLVPSSSSSLLNKKRKHGAISRTTSSSSLSQTHSIESDNLHSHIPSSMETLLYALHYVNTKME